jgi:ABC-type lipoprotein export system ATPase subunit
MQFHLQHIVPLPLLEKGDPLDSEIWNKDVVWQRSQMIQIVANSGTGKTSLIHALYGLRKDVAGKIVIGNQLAANINSDKWSILRMKHISIVFQDLRLLPEYTAWENVMLKHELQPTYTIQVIQDWFVRLGIGEKMNTAVRFMSRGEQQRVAIIRALVQPFDFILLDEPFSHLDEGNAIKAADLIYEIIQQQHAGLIHADLRKLAYFNYHTTYLL